MTQAAYIHGTSSAEQARLAEMNRILNGRELGLLELEGTERVLEMGAGTGIFARELAPRVGSVLGIERDPRQLATARSHPLPGNLELREGDVLAPPLSASEWGSFDLVHARFLLEHLTDPELAVRVLARAVRPGGSVVLVDDDHATLRLWPEAPRVERLWRAYCELYTARGMDPWIGRRLVALLAEAGLEPRDSSQIFFGASTGMELFPAVVGNLLGVVQGAAADVLRSNLLAATEIDAGLGELRSWAAHPVAALWYAVPFARAVRRP